ncbi:MAG: helix-turn-helix domain-containing protein [Enterococcus sp.]
MYQNILDKNGYCLLTIYHLLFDVYPNAMSLQALSEKVSFSLSTIKRVCHEWRAEGQHFLLGVDFIIDQKRIKLMKLAEFDESQLLAYLLKKSSKIELLQGLFDFPYTSLTALAKEHFLSRATVTRRFNELKPFLAQYQLTLDFEKRPYLKGDETQIRILLFHLQLISQGKTMINHPQECFKQMAIVLKKRRSLGFIIPETKNTKTDYCSEFLNYQISEQSFPFLWKQILGCEQYWPFNKNEIVLLGEKIFPIDKLFQPIIQREQLIREIIRVHLFCRLFVGPLFLMIDHPHRYLKETVQLNQTFLLKIPDYRSLIRQHPELLMYYDYLLRKFLINQQFEEN